jgi:hypothetical protein
MAIYDFFLSRNNGPTANDYVGHSGRLFYDPAERVLRISDGVTVGGEVLNGLVTVANTEPTENFQGQIWLDPQTFELSVYHNGNFIPTIDVATSTKLGGVKLGPGVTVNGDGQIIIDSEGLDFSFGNLTATTGTYPADYYQEERQDQDYAVLGSIAANEDIVIASNGTGAVRVVGDFSVRRANGNLLGALEEEPIFRVKSDGQVQMLVPAADSSEGAVTIVGGLDGVFQAPVNTGVMFHITGIASSPDPTPSRIYNDAQNSFSAIVSRRYNGTAAAPSAVSDGEEIMRMSGTAHNGTLIPGVANQRIVYRALGNQTPSNQGGNIELWATPLNTITLTKIATVDSTGITLESGKVFTGNVTGNVSGTTGQFTNINNSLQTINANVGAFQTYANVSFNSLATGANANTAAYLATATINTTGNITAGNISDSVGLLRSIPQNSKNTGYTLQSTDNGQMINITTGNVTIPAGVFNSPFGQTVSIFNNQTTSNAVVQGSGVTLRLAGTTATGNRTLARYGVATLICVAANTFVISGAGLS